MPLSEFLRMARGKLESGQQKQCPTDLSNRDEKGLVELVWGNGQIMMQGHSSRARTSPIRQSLPTSKTPRASRTGKFGGVESMLNDISPVVPSADLDMSQDDEMVPWFSYPISDTLPQDYCSQLLPEISGVTGLTPNSIRNSFVLPEKRSSYDQTVGNFHSGGNSKGSSSKARTLCSWGPPSDPSLKSGISDIISNNTSIYGNSAQGRDMVNDMKMERPNNSNLLNFSTFSKPASLVNPNLTNPDAIHASVASGVERKEVKEKGSSNIDRTNIIQKDTNFHVSSAICDNANSRQAVAKAPNETCVLERIENSSSVKNDKPVILSNTASSTKVAPGGVRNVEPMVTSSSVGSGNSADRASFEQTYNSKRKFRDMEDSECRSDDIETESVGAKKPSSGRGGAGSKRSRAAEVHNLSERRRRDRINEKMRALQELIPNCNKADKASMLDEAIEYLKTLQLQVQIMSMGAGLCMPPMMFPTGMQHMHPSHVPHFSPMGVGMGMGMGFGMGMLDMNGGSPLYPVPPMTGSHFPSSMSGPANFPRIPGQNIPLYAHADQGLHSSVPRLPVIPLTGRTPVTSAVGLSAPRVGNHSEEPSTSPVLNSEDVMSNKNSQSMCNAEARSSVDHRSTQPKATNEVLVQPTAVQENKHATDVNGHPSITSITETDNRAS